MGQHPLHPVRRQRRHPTPTATRTEPTPSTGERHQTVVLARPAHQPREPTRRVPARLEALQLPPHPRRQTALCSLQPTTQPRQPARHHTVQHRPPSATTDLQRRHRRRPCTRRAKPRTPIPAHTSTAATAVDNGRDGDRSTPPAPPQRATWLPARRNPPLTRAAPPRTAPRRSPPAPRRCAPAPAEPPPPAEPRPPPAAASPPRGPSPARSEPAGALGW
jgi:hypothetical protein